MSVLTKIFVVLVTFLSVLLVALVVPFVARTEDYRAQLEVKESARLKAETAAALGQREMNALEQRHGEQLALKESAERTLKDQIAQLTIDLDDARADVSGLEDEKTQAQVSMGYLAASNAQYAAITESQRQELGKYRTLAADDSRKAVELADQINLLASQRDALERQVRQSKEKSAELEARMTQVEGLWAKVPQAMRDSNLGEQQKGVAEESFEPETPIHGRVTLVEQAGDDTFVELNVGANDGVAVNMKFWVERGGEYLGTVVIVKVVPGASAGVVKIAQGEIAAGDAVLTGREDL